MSDINLITVNAFATRLGMHWATAHRIRKEFPDTFPKPVKTSCSGRYKLYNDAELSEFFDRDYVLARYNKKEVLSLDYRAALTFLVGRPYAEINKSILNLTMRVL